MFLRRRERSTFGRELARPSAHATREKGHDMGTFTVEMTNQPGELARLCEAMAARAINVVICGTTRGDAGTIAFIADDEASARTALDGAGIDFTERPALTVRMENVPGAGAATFRKLADAGLNVDLVLPVRVSDAEFLAVIAVDDTDAARRALGDQVV